ncbi:TetR/AcrR family transcriptional regulator [Nordella sp. HKS 07]|uniref:TetR/AcrR family transcriptional regulator n=1 Tax=Nordella sp. HKS 07 TaxID=2712222 RepID=UPI0013E1DF1F|nr:TetR/AcrR family transcriptional regulator [Nordella sp. HKS 07]QIG50495.1 TetR/AcrR family transcriptional regulator [Nordella sp. HKS 07]
MARSATARGEAAPRARDAEATQKRILAAAKREFSRLGLGGARVDDIAEKANANKRMIYHYFGSKEDLFKKVLEDAYQDIRAAESKLDLAGLPAEAALEKLVRFTWKYYLDHPEFLTLVNSENLHKARHLKTSQNIEAINRPLHGMVQDIIDRGVREGVFRSGIDEMQLNVTIAAVSYYYFTNRFTGAVVYKRDFMTPEALQARIDFNVDTILRLVRA